MSSISAQSAVAARRRRSHPDYVEFNLDPTGVLELQGTSGLLPRSQGMKEPDKQRDRLLGGSVEVAAGFEIHDEVVQDGVMRMQELEAIELPPGGSVEVKPGGRHLEH